MKYGLLISFVAFIWAGSFIAVKIAVKEVDPVTLAFLRFAIASPLMAAAVFLFNKDAKIKKLNHIPYIVIIALTGVTLLYILQFYGIKYTKASNAGVLINMNVLFIAILSVIFLKEKMNSMKFAGIIMGFAGAAIIVSPTFSINLNMGNILILLSAFSWAVYSIVGKKLLEEYDAITITTYAFIIGTLAFIPFLHFPARISLKSWTCILYLAILCSVFGYVAWYKALEKMEASKVAIYLNLIPLFSIILAFFILKEVITLSIIAGAILIMIGIYLTEKA